MKYEASRMPEENKRIEKEIFEKFRSVEMSL